MYKEENHIGSKGCEHLSRGNWPKFNYINLRYFMITLEKNNIGDEALKKLANCSWRNLI